MPWKINRVELGYNVIKGTECFVSLLTRVVMSEGYYVKVNTKVLVGSTEYLTLYMRCRIN